MDRTGFVEENALLRSGFSGRAAGRRAGREAGDVGEDDEARCRLGDARVTACDRADGRRHGERRMAMRGAERAGIGMMDGRLVAAMWVIGGRVARVDMAMRHVGERVHGREAA